MIYEIKKMFLRKEVWIVLCISLIAVVILNCRDKWAGFRKTIIAGQKLTAYSTLSLDEAYAALEKETKQLGSSASSPTSSKYDAWKVLDEMKSGVKMHQEQEQKMQSLIIRMYQDLDQAENDFERRDLTKAIKMYNRRINYPICTADSLNAAVLNLNYNPSIHYLYLLVLCTLSAPLFTVESETGMYQVLYPSKKGKKGLFYKKLLSGALCAAFIAFIYTLTTLMITWMKYGLSIRLILAPIQATVEYRNCPFTMSVFTYAILVMMMRTLIGILLTAVTSLISCFVKKTMIVFSADAIFFAALILISELFSYEPTVRLIMKKLGLIRLQVLSDYLTQYETINVCGLPVMQIWLSVACTVCISFLILTLAFGIYTRSNSRSDKQVKS